MGNTRPPIKPVQLAAGAGWLWQYETDDVEVHKQIFDTSGMCYTNANGEYSLEDGRTITVSYGVITSVSS